MTDEQQAHAGAGAGVAFKKYFEKEEKQGSVIAFRSASADYSSSGMYYRTKWAFPAWLRRNVKGGQNNAFQVSNRDNTFKASKRG